MFADLLRRLAGTAARSRTTRSNDSLALHHLRRGGAADRRLDQPVDVGDVQAVARDLGRGRR